MGAGTAEADLGPGDSHRGPERTPPPRCPCLGPTPGGDAGPCLLPPLAGKARGLPQLRDEEMALYFLSPYSPELNDIEPYFGWVQQQEMPIRSYTSTPKFIQAMHAAFRLVEADLVTRQHSMPTA